MLFWNSGSLKPDPWDVIEVTDSNGVRIAKIADVSASADGALGIAGANRRVYLFDKTKNQWVQHENYLNNYKDYHNKYIEPKTNIKPI